VEAVQASAAPAVLVPVTCSPPGADGGVTSAAVSDRGVTTETELDEGDRCPSVSRAATRNEYCPVGWMLEVMVTVVTFPASCSQKTSLNAWFQVTSYPAMAQQPGVAAGPGEGDRPGGDGGDPQVGGCAGRLG
jgi:hypothetical protein